MGRETSSYIRENFDPENIPENIIKKAEEFSDNLNNLESTISDLRANICIYVTNTDKEVSLIEEIECNIDDIEKEIDKMKDTIDRIDTISNFY